MKEDIEMLKEFAHDLLQDYIYSPDEVPQHDKKLSKAIENLISRYKELEEKNKDLKCNYYNMAEQKLKLVKENIELNDELQMTKNSMKIANLDVMEDYIPKSKVREIIEDIDNSQPVIAELKLRKLVEGESNATKM